VTRTLLPRGPRAVDLALLVVLGTLALLGMLPLYTGWQFLAVGLLGLVLGAGAAQLAWARRWPTVAAVLLGLAVFVVLAGPLCLRSTGGYLPGRELLDTVVLGWKDLLTTLPPVDGSGPLLVLPWLLGTATGVLGGVLVGLPRRVPAPVRLALPLLAPTALLAVVVLLGVRAPSSLLLQGVAFAVLALAWLVARGLAGTVTVSGRRTGTVRRFALGGLMVAVATAVAVPLAGAGTTDEQRTVLREKVVPPVDIGQYGSPLSAFRRYVKDSEPASLNLHDDTLMTVDGVRAGTRVRFAALDRYDGTVWTASEGPAHALPGRKANAFLRVSEEIHNPTEGPTVDVEVRLGEGWSGVWLPTVGSLQTMSFGDDRELADRFRYNLATSTAIVEGGLGAGDTYRFSAVLPDDRLTGDVEPSAEVDPDVQAAGAFLQAASVELSKGADTPMGRVLRIADQLRSTGFYSDGVKKSERSFTAGHYERRLGLGFLDADLKVGNDEQYAAAMALLANRVGVPARVVMGAVVPPGGEVRGKDVHAWVEVRADDGTWRTLPTDAFMRRRAPAEQPPQERQRSSGSEVPPPNPVPPPSTLGGQDERDLRATKDTEGEEGDAGLQVPGWLKVTLVAVGSPLLLVLLFVGAVVGAKAWRRSRRRRTGRPATRVNGAWRELVDHARDLGHGVRISGTTRREQAGEVERGTGAAGVPALARQADGHVFGPAGPTDADAAAYWDDVATARRDLSRGLGRWQRLRGTLSLQTFVRRWGREPEPARRAEEEQRV